ncbi:MAG: hypothetical protein ACLPYZ_13585 [Limisphaerales bacterium]
MAISQSQNNLAWLLATCPEASIRNGTKAVELRHPMSGQVRGPANGKIKLTHCRGAV